MNPTHYYKGKPVEFIERTYQHNGHQYCTILMVNSTGKEQRQTVQERHLTPVAADALCDCYISVPAGNYPDLCAHCGKKARR